MRFRYTYWGEYPLGFAVCLGQAECVRLLQAKGANINLRDTNGNTALHLVIIHYNKVRSFTPFVHYSIMSVD
jgi:ankyrin repeat protein